MLILVLSCVLLVGAEYIPDAPNYQCPVDTAFIYPCKCIAPGDNGLHVICDNANLATLSVGLNNLAIDKPLIDNLTIADCNIARFYGSVFHKLRVKNLYLINVPVGTIEPHVFWGINRTLQQVIIGRSALTAFPSQAIQYVGNITSLVLDGHKIESLENATFSSAVYNALKHLRISNGHIAEIPLDVLTGFRKLKYLDLHGNRITSLKKNQFKGLRELEVLDLSFNDLTKVEPTQISDLPKLGWLNVSNNHLTELTRGMLARNTVIKVINCSANNLKRIDSNSFRGLRFLRRLYFADNNITDVGRGTFQGRIGTIDLARNRLKKVDYEMFAGLNYAEEINLAENQITEVQTNGFKDLYLTRVNLSRNALRKLDKNAFTSCTNMTLLDMSYNDLSNIPLHAFAAMSYSSELQVSYNNLTSLAQVPLLNMTGITVLNVSHNSLKVIPRNVFPKLYELHTIDLSFNQLTDIANGVFQVLLSLRHLDLSNNHLVTLKSAVFGAVPTLLSMDLSYNLLNDVSRGAFTRLSSLRVLNVSHNQLNALFQIPISLGSLDMSHNNMSRIASSADTWPTMNSLLSLNLRNNNLGDNLEEGSFAKLLTLQSLDLSYNELTETPWKSLGDLSSLQYLDLVGNQLTSLQKTAFGRLPIVFELNLSDNQISNISVKAFDGLLQLLKLNLSNNKLAKLTNGAFQGLVSLRSLDLSNNSLDKLDNKTHGLLEDCLSLETINLKGNRFGFLSKLTFPSSPYVPYKLKHVDLSYNSLVVVDREFVRGTKKLQYLNLRGNMINEVNKGVLPNLTELQVLDLSHNQLTKLRDGYLGPPNNLTELYLSDNFLTTLPVEDLNVPKIKLKVVDVRRNQLTEFPMPLLKLLQEGANILLAENPVECNCRLLPIKQWTSQQPEGAKIGDDENWTSVKCRGPQKLANMSITVVAAEKLKCPSMLVEPLYILKPHVYFRSIVVSNKGLTLQWIVASKADIADIYLVIRALFDEKIFAIFERLLPYDSRKTSFLISDFQKYADENKLPLLNKTANFEFCLYPLDSMGEMLTHRPANPCKPFNNFQYPVRSGTSDPLILPALVVFSLVSLLCIEYG